MTEFNKARKGRKIILYTYYTQETCNLDESFIVIQTDFKRNNLTFFIGIYTDMDELMVGVLEHEPCLLQAG